MLSDCTLLRFLILYLYEVWAHYADWSHLSSPAIKSLSETRAYEVFLSTEKLSICICFVCVLLNSVALLRVPVTPFLCYIISFMPPDTMLYQTAPAVVRGNQLEYHVKNYGD